MSKAPRKLPTTRHFDCMKRCPMDCSAACKRSAYPSLVAALKAVCQPQRTAYDGRGSAVGDALALLRRLGEAP